ncbi:hypothetical protein KY360_06720 [Candidatus Woesearchaeota archaeon]|nr:hypothetical protein [Candidatus Woesearchaeota archaeon]
MGNIDPELKKRTIREFVQMLDAKAREVGVQIQYGYFSGDEARIGGDALVERFLNNGGNAALFRSAFEVYLRSDDQNQIATLTLEMAQNRSGGAAYNGKNPIDLESQLNVGLVFDDPFYSIGVSKEVRRQPKIGDVELSESESGISPSNIDHTRINTYSGNLESQLEQAKTALRKRI